MWFHIKFRQHPDPDAYFPRNVFHSDTDCNSREWSALLHFQTSLSATWNRLRRGRTVKFNIYICRTLSIKIGRPPKGTVLDASLWLAATVRRFPREAQPQRMIACFWFRSTGMLRAHWWKIKGCGWQTEPCQKKYPHQRLSVARQARQIQPDVAQIEQRASPGARYGGGCVWTLESSSAYCRHKE